MREDNHVALGLIKAKAEFIRQNLLSSEKEVFEFHDLVLEDVFDLIHRVSDYSVWGGEHIVTGGLPVKLFGKNIYRKKDLIYRVEEILASVNFLLGRKEKENGSDTPD